MFKKFAFAAIALTTVAGSDFAYASPQDIILANDSGRAITEARFSPPSSVLAGPDLLPDVLTDGNATPVYFPSGVSRCVWDMTVVFLGGDRATGRYNLCDTSIITVR